MNSKFFELKKEKQDRIINAALKVFALQGYRHATADDIVREAAISKGLLFHYFQSKLGVYHFIYDYSVKFMNLELRSYVNSSETDLFAVMKQVEFARMSAMKGYSYMQMFLVRAATEDCEEVRPFIAEKGVLLEETYAAINAQIDYSTLPEGVDGEKLRKILNFTTQGLLTEHLRRPVFQPESYYREICEYLDLMKSNR